MYTYMMIVFLSMVSYCSSLYATDFMQAESAMGTAEEVASSKRKSSKFQPDTYPKLPKLRHIGEKENPFADLRKKLKILYNLNAQA